MPQVGFDPPKQREDCYQSTTLPTSHQGWITLKHFEFFSITFSTLFTEHKIGSGYFVTFKLDREHLVKRHVTCNQMQLINQGFWMLRTGLFLKTLFKYVT